MMTQSNVHLKSRSGKWLHFLRGTGSLDHTFIMEQRAENKHANWPSCFLLFTCFNSHNNKLYNSCTNQIIWSTAFAAMTISCQIKVDNSFGFWSACIFHQHTLVLTDWKIMLRFRFYIERLRKRVIYSVARNIFWYMCETQAYSCGWLEGKKY